MSLRCRGISLIEVIVVVTLITAMMVISLPTLSSANAKARSELCQQNLQEIGRGIASYTQDQGRFPSLYATDPTGSSMSLPEFMAPRLCTPQVAFCPSDETQTSQVFGTSYRWTNAFNGISSDAYDPLLDQPVLADRKAYHPYAPQPINELVIRRYKSGYQLTVPGMTPEPEQAGLSLHSSLAK